MSGHPSLEELEAVALGEAEAAGVDAHVASCAECARELSWLRAEAQLMRRRPAPQVSPELWDRVQQRVHAPIPISRARRRTWVGAAVAVAAAAALAVVVRPGGKPVAPLPGLDASIAEELASDAVVDPKAQSALDRAAGDYRSALSVLEGEFARARGRFDPRTQKRWDESFAKARSLIDASAQARNDLDERLKLLDGSAVMVRSLRQAIEDSEEVTR